MLYEWDGDEGVFSATTWEEQAKHFEQVELLALSPMEIELCWVNQVSGDRVPDKKRCIIDLIIQNSQNLLVKGPDEWTIEVPAHCTSTKPMGFNRYDLDRENGSTYNAEYGNAFENMKGDRGVGSKRKKSVDDSSAFLNSTKTKPKPYVSGQEQDGSSYF
ncbi:hypothetical protein THAOC_23891 [Thalassiosira oceanica]|uniref:Uncharacterized protein n=1 Tax=Thalassiosira oceanica TaxID=159749 RepID=K0SC47_THAOC|nr:hypothetical protein THAOC_23891 [Thalassiosira oceanica]|eukprot:EJK56262.1 hypothetical protein THAOC_23891 [Thalassiosira oceanica]